MLIPLAVLAVGAVFSGMVFYNQFFGQADRVAQFFGVPYESVSQSEHGEEAAPAAEGHGAAAEGPVAEEGNAEEGEGHYVFTGHPGEGAIHMAEGNTVLNDAHGSPVWVKVAPFFAMLIGFLTATLFYIVKPGLPARMAGLFQPLYQFLLNKWYFDEIYNVVFVIPAQWIGRFLWRRGDGDVIDGSINGVAMGIIPYFTRLAGRAQSGYLFHYAFAMVLGIALLITIVTLTFGG